MQGLIDRFAIYNKSAARAALDFMRKRSIVSQEHLLHTLADLRTAKWRHVPDAPGIYWWYFPADCLASFQIDTYCLVPDLHLRRVADGRVCLYHGMAKSLQKRVIWHSAQKLNASALRSGFLSTFRLTLLALRDFPYSADSTAIDRFMDGLAVAWHPAVDVAAAQAAEYAELRGPFHYPLNLSGNHREQFMAFHQHLKSLRRTYKQRHLEMTS